MGGFLTHLYGIHFTSVCWRCCFILICWPECWFSVFCRYCRCNQIQVVLILTKKVTWDSCSLFLTHCKGSTAISTLYFLLFTSCLLGVSPHLLFPFTQSKSATPAEISPTRRHSANRNCDQKKKKKRTKSKMFAYSAELPKCLCMKLT